MQKLFKRLSLVSVYVDHVPIRGFGTNSGKAAGVVWINLPYGGPEGNQTFLRDAAPRESLITQGTSRVQISRQFLKLFHS